MKRTPPIQTLDLDQLACATGGMDNNGRVVTDPGRCSIDNPRGERIYHQSAHSHPRGR